jgi:hypothetical protein
VSQGENGEQLLTLFFSEHQLRHLRKINKLHRPYTFNKNSILLFFSSGLMWRCRASLELPYAAVPFLDPTGWLQGPLDEIRAEKRQNIMLVNFRYE